MRKGEGLGLGLEYEGRGGSGEGRLGVRKVGATMSTFCWMQKMRSLASWTEMAGKSTRAPAGSGMVRYWGEDAMVRLRVKPK